MRDIDLFVVHCSATKPSQDIGVDWIRRIHVRDNRWSDVGYHYVIKRDGTIQQGRPVERPGAHTKGHNMHTIGICLAGGLGDDGSIVEGYDHAFTRDQECAMRRLLRYLWAQYPDAGITGHRDLSPDKNHDGVITKDEWLKNCPCFDVSQLFSRQQVLSHS